MMQDQAAGVTHVQMINFGSTAGDQGDTRLIVRILDLLLPDRGFPITLDGLSAPAATPPP